eukprot:TRINITY_DN2963_c0_g1_i1.p1 TRINITY_DN2963_c0_g1~~TRINITY_DN2963_c0_g1_i1.p1  ORF type:complete len:100 (+),score=21.55 TRINITY_DN2963_c0_g1_i1:69-368(+)
MEYQYNLEVNSQHFEFQIIKININGLLKIFKCSNLSSWLCFAMIRQEFWPKYCSKSAKSRYIKDAIQGIRSLDTISIRGCKNRLTKVSNVKKQELNYTN